MRQTNQRSSLAVVFTVVIVALAFVSGCSSSPKAAPPSTSTTTSSTSTSSMPPSSTTSTTLPPSGSDVALGTNNPAQGDCTTNLSEAATSVGSVALTVTSGTFRADIQLQKGTPDTTYDVFMQQVPGSCPQQTANGGTLTTDSTGNGHASASVARVPGATIFFVQLVPPESGPAQYTSDRIADAS